MSIMLIKYIYFNFLAESNNKEVDKTHEKQPLIVDNESFRETRNTPPVTKKVMMQGKLPN